MQMLVDILIKIIAARLLYIVREDVKPQAIREDGKIKHSAEETATTNRKELFYVEALPV